MEFSSAYIHDFWKNRLWGSVVVHHFVHKCTPSSHNRIFGFWKNRPWGSVDVWNQKPTVPFAIYCIKQKVKIFMLASKVS